MSSSIFDVLVSLKLSIIRRAADMLVLHFGAVRAHSSGRGTVGEYALHIQCSWRLDRPDGTITGRSDLWEYAGQGKRPDDWSYEDGLSLQDKKLSEVFGEPDERLGWVNRPDGFSVLLVEESTQGDVKISLSNAHSISIFPDSCASEAWRFFALSDRLHHVFPAEEKSY
jgi:hypothetical protein